MRRLRTVMFALVLVAFVAACGDDHDDGGASTTTSSTRPRVTTTSSAVELTQPAVWPAADVVFDTPEAVARDFVAKVLGVTPRLGSFQQGDARSGEMAVFAPGSGTSDASVVRGVLLLRQLGPSDAWFVLAVANDNASVTVPSSAATVPAAPLEVSGRARGFEAQVVVTAFRAGDRSEQLDEVTATGGATATPEPFTATVDLSHATPGDTVVLLVRGGTGRETDPGDFSAIPVVIRR